MNRTHLFRGFRNLAVFAASLAGAALPLCAARAASETTRRNANAIQNYQNRQQTPYYTGQTNPYYGTAPQAGQSPANATATQSLQNQIRRNERRNGQ